MALIKYKVQIQKSIIIVALFVFVYPLIAQEKKLQELTKQYGIPGIQLVCIKGNKEEAFNLGTISNGSDQKGTANTIFKAASLSKSIFAYAVLRLYDRGIIDLDTPLYQREQALEGLMHLATGITIFISLIGLFGLTLFTTGRRTREIGIRKVLGARVTDFLTLLGKDFVRLVLVALVIASAGGWWLMHRWLQDYAYRVRIGVDVFLLAGGILMVITVLTVGLQSLRSALVNPVESLRSE
jgi:ABC-type antimicrobial peptide transport system permease subunit